MNEERDEQTRTGGRGKASVTDFCGHVRATVVNSGSFVRACLKIE